MSLLGFDAVGRLALGQIPSATATLVNVPYPVTPTPVRSRREAGYQVAMMASGGVIPPLLISAPLSWFASLSEPVRIKPGLRASQQQFLAQSDPLPFVSFSWYAELSKPQKLDRPGLSASRQQFLFYQANPTTVTPFAWFANLSEPVRIKPALRSGLQKFFATDTSVIPISKLIAWFAPFSEPVRQKPGLKASLQQFLAAPSQLRPNPTITGILAAQETKDTFLAGVSVFNRATSAEIGIVDTGFPSAEIGIAAPAVASVSISIRII